MIFYEIVRVISSQTLQFPCDIPLSTDAHLIGCRDRADDVTSPQTEVEAGEGSLLGGNAWRR